MPDFDSILARFWTHFWIISEPVFGLKTGALRVPGLSESTRNYNGFELLGCPKELHFGCHFGVILVAILARFLDPLFWGRPAG